MSAILDRLDAELVKRGAALMRHGTGSLLHHMQGVHGILESWGEAPEVCIAGLMHCAYRAESGSQPLFRADERDFILQLVGSRSERLICLLGGIERSQLLASARIQFAGIEKADTFLRTTAAQRLTLEGDELRDIQAIIVAILAEQNCSVDGSPIAWLSDAAAISNAMTTRPLPIFPVGMQIDLADEADLLAAYAQAWSAPLLLGHAARLQAVIEGMPFVAEPFILLGLISVARGEFADADRFAASGQSQLLKWGSAWDKRLPETSWLALALFAQQAAAVPAAEASYLQDTVYNLLRDGAAMPEVLYVQLSARDLLAMPAGVQSESDSTEFETDAVDDVFCDEDANLIPERFAEFLDGLLDEAPQRSLTHYPGLEEKAWWNADAFPLVKALEASAKEIAAEFNALDRAAFHPESERIQRGGDWDVFILFERGRKREERCAAVPITTRIIEEHSTLRTQAGLAYFSRLAPGSVVAPHRGPTNMRLRCHLGISVPDGCRISVGGVTKTWQQGKCIIFDDSFMHAVWNSSDAERVVLIVDIWHPGLDQEEIDFLSGLHRYGTALAGGVEKYWRKNEEALAGVVT